MALTWSTPSRRLNGRELTIIPNEIYCIIFDLVHFSEDATPAETTKLLSNMALVCQFFSAQCLLRIFRSITFSTHNQHHMTAHYNFCRNLGLKQEPALTFGGCVEHCTLVDWSLGEVQHNWVVRGFFDLFVRALPRMRNLQSLVICRVGITKRLLNAICKLPTLTSLTLDRCTVDEATLTSRPFPQFKSTQLSTVVFLKECHAVFQDRNPPNLGLITFLAEAVQTPALRRLHSNSSRFINMFVQKSPRVNLQKLHLEGAGDLDVESMIRFLNSTPTITTLTLEANAPEVEASTEKIFRRIARGVLETALPALEYVRCASNAFEHLVSGRPLRTVHISKIWHLKHGNASVENTSTVALERANAVRALAKGAPHIRVLHAAHNVCMSPEFVQACPQLEALHVDFTSYMPEFSTAQKIADMLLDFCKERAPMPAVTELTLSTFKFDQKHEFYWDLSLQHQIITNLASSKAFPSVTKMSFSPDFTSGVIWQRDSAKIWRAQVARDVRAQTKRLLTETPHEVVDHGGCFTDLFSRAEMVGDVLKRLRSSVKRSVAKHAS